MSKELSLQPDEILETTQVVAKVSRIDNIKGSLITSGASSGIAGVLLVAAGAPPEILLGGVALTGLFSTQLESFFSMKREAGNYIEMISMHRREITEKELFRAWSFLPGKASKRSIETFYVNEGDGVFKKRLKSGLMYNSKRCDKSVATHSVTHEIKSSWRGVEVIQTIEPLETYLWSHAFSDVTALYEINMNDTSVDLEKMKGTTIPDRIRELESITSKEQ
jgi:hypothetical protein